MSIYDKHNSAFKQVSAYAILMDGTIIGKIAVKYPADGAGRVTAYLHIFGTEMVAGTASGYGYDKTSAAIESAAGKLAAFDHDSMSGSIAIAQARKVAALLSDIGGRDAWAVLNDAGIGLIGIV